jgi:hypothetical protein
MKGKVMTGEGEDDRRLKDALRAIAEDDEMLGTSPQVRERLLAEVHAIARPRWNRMRLLQLAAAAILFVAIALPAWYAARRVPTATSDDGGEPFGGAQGRRVQVSIREEATDFFPLAYSNVPAPGGYVVRMQVPRATLDSFGVTEFASPDDRSTTVAADVIVGGDGLARAVRFVREVRVSQ